MIKLGTIESFLLHTHKRLELCGSMAFTISISIQISALSNDKAFNFIQGEMRKKCW